MCFLQQSEQTQELNLKLSESNELKLNHNVKKNMIATCFISQFFIVLLFTFS